MVLVIISSCLILLVGGCSDSGTARFKGKIPQAQFDQEMKFREQTAYRIKEAITPLDPKVRTFALRMAGIFPGPYNFGQVCAVWYYLKDRWRYVNDPRDMDYFAPAFESIESNLSGDCDDFAVLMASAIEAIGGSSRVVVAYGKRGSHAYCEVFTSDDPERLRRLIDSLADTEAYIHALEGYSSNLKDRSYRLYFHRDAKGWWLNLDYSAVYPGGPIFPAYFEMAVYPDGNYEILKER